MQKILFVCLGNICRSPAAEAVFRSVAEEEGFQCEVESAGTAGYHEGNPADGRMRKAGAARGYLVDSIARAFCPEKDFQFFDLICTMDNDNYKSLIAACPDDSLSRMKIRKFTSFCKDYSLDEVPDPYYGSGDGFEYVLDIIEDGCRGVLEYCQSESL